jgi:hypothetical protein
MMGAAEFLTFMRRKLRPASRCVCSKPEVSGSARENRAEYWRRRSLECDFPELRSAFAEVARSYRPLARSRAVSR